MKEPFMYTNLNGEMKFVEVDKNTKFDVEFIDGVRMEISYNLFMTYRTQKPQNANRIIQVYGVTK